MGMLVYFYLDMKPQDQKAIAGEIYGTGVKQLESWLHCVTELRNRCAPLSAVVLLVFSVGAQDAGRV